MKSNYRRRCKQCEQMFELKDLEYGFCRCCFEDLKNKLRGGT